MSERADRVLADEPTGNLDTASAKEVIELMRRFDHESQTTCAASGNDPSEMLESGKNR